MKLLRATDPESWILMPIVLGRIANFCGKYETTMDASVLTRAVAAAFGGDRPDAICALAIIDGERVVGHGVADLEPWSGRMNAAVLQYEADVPIPAAVRAEGLALIEEWARGNGAENLTLAARMDSPKDLARTRLFGRLGFEPKSVCMKRAIVPRDSVGPPELSAGAKV